MGGHAIKTVKISRFDLKSLKDVQDTLSNMLPIKLTFLRSLPDKTTYGDLDVLVTNIDIKKVKDMIILIINPVELHTNYNIINFAFNYNNNYYQIDIIVTQNLPMTLFTLSYAVTNMILGSILKQGNMKLTSEDLYLILNQKYNPLFVNNEKLLLTSDPKILCEYMSLDYDRWLQGFNTNHDCYTWLISGNIDITYVYNIQIKNPSMEDFSTFMKDIPEKAFCYRDPIKWFNVEIQINDLIQKKVKNDYRKSKFNGKILMSLGVEQKDIKCVTCHIIECISQIEPFISWLDKTPQEEINNTILTLIKSDKY